jgi:hypothetical protein
LEVSGMATPAAGNDWKLIVVAWGGMTQLRWML